MQILGYDTEDLAQRVVRGLRQQGCRARHLFVHLPSSANCSARFSWALVLLGTEGLIRYAHRLSTFKVIGKLVLLSGLGLLEVGTGVFWTFTTSLLDPVILRRNNILAIRHVSVSLDLSAVLEPFVIETFVFLVSRLGPLRCINLIRGRFKGHLKVVYSNFPSFVQATSFLALNRAIPSFGRASLAFHDNNLTLLVNHTGRKD